MSNDILRLRVLQLVIDTQIGLPGTIGHVHDPVPWYRINYVGMQKNVVGLEKKEKLGWTGKSSFVLEVPPRHLRPSIIYNSYRSMPLWNCDLLIWTTFNLILWFEMLPRVDWLIKLFNNNKASELPISHDVTNIQTRKQLILLRFYFHDV